VWYAPGNDPLVITVGCLDENETVTASDDSVCSISSRGITSDGFAKRDVVAPGRKIVSALSSGASGHGSVLAAELPDRITSDGRHLRLSGTSMSAPMVSGALALILQRHPQLTPSQLKQLLVQTAVAYPGQADRAGMLNIAGALTTRITRQPIRRRSRCLSAGSPRQVGQSPSCGTAPVGATPVGTVRAGPVGIGTARAGPAHTATARAGTTSPGTAPSISTDFRRSILAVGLWVH
jgi:subtilisin family serine protease